MKSVSPVATIVLVDDGELEDVARVLEAGGLSFERYRGGQIPDRLEEPRDLLIVTARRLEHVLAPPKLPEADRREGPLRIAAVSDDSPALRRRLRRRGIQLLVRLPAQRETWRLLIARALHQGDERRTDPRVTPDLPVEAELREAMLVDLSNRGCRIQTRTPLAVGDAVRFSIPAASLPDGRSEPLPLSGRIRRIAQLAGSDRRTCAVVFDADLPRTTRQRLTSAINHWASGDSAALLRPAVEGPAIPACRLPSLPDLMLDDETDPPIRAGSDVAIELSTRVEPHAAESPETSETNRRGSPRGLFPAVVRATHEERPIAVVGRDLSARGMRIERHPELALGDRFRLALHGPTLARPLLLDATVVRDDADQGLALAFLGVSRETGNALEKLVACLPDVESLEDGELAGMGSVLSEIVRD
ncbi:MAG: PilZ domain-containing protein [Deltaproteobacteria bacterium]|nr:PilZ domain-containing protein [Deltaproteobacteria bacterium]